MGKGRAAVAVLCAVQFVDVLGVTVVTTALPAMLESVGAPASAATLVATGYAMFFGGLLMLGGRLGDRFGHRRVLLAGLAGFGAASVVAALAGSVAVLVSARCLQGAAAAASVPTGLRLLSAVATGEDARRRALAAWSATGAAAGASGLLLGGVMTDLTGWRALFWLNVPLAIGLMAGVARVVPTTGRDRTMRLDAVGAALLTVAVMVLVLGATLVIDRPAAGIGGLVAGGALLAAFALVERRVRDPLLPRAALRSLHLRAGASASWLNTATTSSTMTLATLYLQGERGASATTAGLALLPFSLCVVVGAALAAGILRRRPPAAAIVLGLAVIGAGNALLLAGPWALPAGAGVAGLGIGIASVAATTLGTDVPDDLQGTAAGLLNTAAQLGTALGVAALLLVAAAGSTQLAWACGAALAVAGAVRAAVRS